MSNDVASLIAALDELYRSIVDDPGPWDDAALARWLEDLAAAIAPNLARPDAALVRRQVRLARRLRRHLLDAEARGGSRPTEWTAAVDAALGGRGWLPTLELARRGLEARPSLELFEEVRRRFRVAYFRPWMDGVDYDEWLRQRPVDPGGSGSRAVS